MLTLTAVVFPRELMNQRRGILILWSSMVGFQVLRQLWYFNFSWYLSVHISSTSLKSVNTHNSKEAGIGVHIHSKIEMDKIFSYRETAFENCSVPIWRCTCGELGRSWSPSDLMTIFYCNIPAAICQNLNWPSLPLVQEETPEMDVSVLAFFLFSWAFQ